MAHFPAESVAHFDRNTHLVVDDNPSDVRLAIMGFSKIRPECSVTSVPDGRQAIRLLRQIADTDRSAFDLILLDLNLPYANGFEVLDVTRRELGLLTPVVIFSTSTQAQDHRTALDHAANEFLVKPSTLDGTFHALASIVSRWCRTVPCSA